MRARRVNASRATRFRQAPRANAYSSPRRGFVMLPIGGLDRAQNPLAADQRSWRATFGECGNLVRRDCAFPSTNRISLSQGEASDLRRDSLAEAWRASCENVSSLGCRCGKFA